MRTVLASNVPLPVWQITVPSIDDGRIAPGAQESIGNEHLVKVDGGRTGSYAHHCFWVTTGRRRQTKN